MVCLCRKTVCECNWKPAPHDCASCGTRHTYADGCPGAPGWPGVDATPAQMAAYEAEKLMYLSFIRGREGQGMPLEDMQNYLFAAAYWTGFCRGKNAS